MLRDSKIRRYIPCSGTGVVSGNCGDPWCDCMNEVTCTKCKGSGEITKIFSPKKNKKKNKWK